MPVYEFLCRNCGRTKEKSYKIDERPGGVVCSACGDIAKVKPSLGCFHLAGSGWASTGYDKVSSKK